ncbi:MAG: response regulator transcription factor [Verrucomicrobiales bacterium]
MNILLVEDESKLAAHVSRALGRHGHVVETRGDGVGAIEAVLARPFELVVLDVNLPGCDGFEVLRRIRQAGLAARVLMLTARAEIGDRVAGLRAGADDYLGKPFALEELLARIEALGRRATGAGAADTLSVRDIRMDVRQRRVWRAGEVVALSPREFEVLQIFMQEPGRTFSRDEICERIWQCEHEYDTRTVEIFIMRLRRKLDDGPAAPLIETVRGAGYRLCP